MEYKNIFEIEFIQRTQEIVNGYQIPFENTLFINACVGLLIIPQQSLFNHLPTEVVSADKWGIADTDISCIKEPNKSVKNVARHIRNAIAHDGIRFGSDNGKDITHIKITDWKDERHKTETFKAVIEVTKFKTFVWAFAQFALTQQSLFKSQNGLAKFRVTDFVKRLIHKTLLQSLSLSYFVYSTNNLIFIKIK